MIIKKLFENKMVVVLDKPAGISVHPDGKRKEKTVTSFLTTKYKSIKDVGESMFVESEGKLVEIKRPGIVHRLDKDTSGCLIVAKTQEAFLDLKSQFQDRKVKKEYQALVYGHIKNDTGIIDFAIGRSENDFRKKQVVRPGLIAKIRGDSRDAKTRYRVVKRFEILGEKITSVVFFPETGRMHQIRVHANALGYPILGDHLYGAKHPKIEKKIFGGKKVRQLLHARAVSFTDPLTEDFIKVESKLPKELSL